VWCVVCLVVPSRGPGPQAPSAFPNYPNCQLARTRTAVCWPPGVVSRVGCRVWHVSCRRTAVGRVGHRVSGVACRRPRSAQAQQPAGKRPTPTAKQKQFKAQRVLVLVLEVGIGCRNQAVQRRPKPPPKKTNTPDPRIPTPGPRGEKRTPSSAYCRRPLFLSRARSAAVLLRGGRLCATGRH
jgi:hypothetical protein